MKVLLVIFTICISYTLGEGNTKVIEKFYPKKYRSYNGGKIYIKAAKYEKSSNPPVARPYTAFQLVEASKKMSEAGVPDSPYFPVDLGYDQKPRVKKVLPLDYPWSLLRNKRSAVLNVPTVKEDDKKIEPKAAEVEKVKENTPIPTGAAIETTVRKLSSPKEAQESKITVTINTTEAESTTDNKEIERTGSNTAKKNNPVGTGKNQPKSKTAPKKNSARVNRNSKPKGKKAAAGRAKPKVRQAKSAKKRKTNQVNKAARKKDKKRKGNTQKSKKQKANPNKGRAGKTPKDTRRLIAAREALIEDYPYVVSIQKDGQHWCSGALVNNRVVITTVNCLWKANHISRMKVRTGSRHSNRGGQMASIQEVIKHPGWGLRRNPDNDVALLLLDTFIRALMGLARHCNASGMFAVASVDCFYATMRKRSAYLVRRFRGCSNSVLMMPSWIATWRQSMFSDVVHGVDLPNRAMLPPFDDAWVTSWGSERRDGVYDKYDSTSLQVFHARLIDREKCNNITKRFGVVVTENFICLAQSGRQAPCTRDTGAPAVSDGILWGLASWGIRKLCGTERFPAVFSYLASHSNMDFIMNATRLLMSDKRQYPFPDRYPSSLMKRK